MQMHAVQQAGASAGGRKKRGHRQVSAGCVPSSPTVPLNCYSRANARACVNCTGGVYETIYWRHSLHLGQ